MVGLKRSPLVLMIFIFFAIAKNEKADANVCGDIRLMPCDNLECITRDGWCDKRKDCEDGSDEKYCKQNEWYTLPRIDNHCLERLHFTCDNARCIPKETQCDEFDDCGDFSDEDYCDEIITNSPTYPSPREREDSLQPTVAPNTEGSNSIHSYDYNGHQSRTRITSPPSHDSVDYYDRKTIAESVDQDQRNVYNSNRNNDDTPNLPRQGVDVSRTNQSRRQHRNNQRHIYQYPPRPTNGSQRPTQRTYDQENTNYNTPNSRNHNNPQSTRTHDNRQGNQNNNNYNSRRRHEYENNNNQYHLYTEPTPSRGYSFRYAPPTRVPPTPTIRYEPRTFRNESIIVQRQEPEEIHPRVVLHPPPPRQLYYPKRKVSPLSLPPFYFEKNYTHTHGFRYRNNVENARDWLLGQRDIHNSWKENTSRALVSLSLIENSFTSDVVDNELMMKGLKTHLSIRLLRNTTEVIPMPRLAMYINALLATCQNPRDFMGMDLVDILIQRLGNVRRPYEMNPFVYLTLCLSGVNVDRSEIQKLQHFLSRGFLDQMLKEQHILATSAMACFLQQTPEDYELRRIADLAVNDLLLQMLNDGSFGDLYSTALAAQALMSVNTSGSWDPRRTLDYIAARQNETGSFGDMLSTYYSIPALRGRSLLHIRNTECTKPVENETSSPLDILNPDGPMKRLFITVSVGYPEINSYSMQLNVRDYATLYDCLRAAEYLDPRFKFESTDFYGITEVHTILNIPNDPERGLQWNLYQLQKTSGRKRIDLTQNKRTDIKREVPSDGEEFLFWYLPSI